MPRHADPNALFLAPGTATAPPCPVCGAARVITRGLHGPTGFAAAIAHRQGVPGMTRDYDLAACPHTAEGWHERAQDLTDEAEATRSEALRAQLLAERAEVVRARAPDA